MSIAKKSLISNRTAVKKANLTKASATKVAATKLGKVLIAPHVKVSAALISTRVR